MQDIPEAGMDIHPDVSDQQYKPYRKIIPSFQTRGFYFFKQVKDRFYV